MKYNNEQKTSKYRIITLDIPTNQPLKTLYGTMYFDVHSKELFIHDGTDWTYVALINIPTNP